MHMKLKEKELWLELYDIAKNIQKLEPWKYLWNMDLLVYLSQLANKTFYCSVMGHAGFHKAIAIYQDEQIHSFFYLANNDNPKYLYLNYEE